MSDEFKLSHMRETYSYFGGPHKIVYYARPVRALKIAGCVK